ncbi:hypothetical protein HDU89_003216 [Geranomyces variabilis]|nr:hypothetical protein HDU89_003216 [Geranomyces variabilis]
MFDESKWRDANLTRQGLITKLNFCKVGVQSFHDQTAGAKLASAKNVIRKLREFFSTFSEPYFIAVLDGTIDALTENDANGQRHVRRAHLLDELTRNLNFSESELADLKSLGAIARLGAMEEVFTGARAMYRNNQEKLPPFFRIMEMTLDALTDSVTDEWGQQRRCVRQVVSPHAVAAPFPALRPPNSGLPALTDEEEEENDAMRKTRCSGSKINEPRTQVKPADAEKLAESLAERATSRVEVFKGHPAYRELISEWLAHSSTLPFNVTTQ